jgi:hypothetical protein
MVRPLLCAEPSTGSVQVFLCWKDGNSILFLLPVLPGKVQRIPSWALSHFPKRNQGREAVSV